MSMKCPGDFCLAATKLPTTPKKGHYEIHGDMQSWPSDTGLKKADLRGTLPSEKYGQKDSDARLEDESWEGARYKSRLFFWFELQGF